jgi:hypothetical protein
MLSSNFVNLGKSGLYVNHAFLQFCNTTWVSCFFRIGRFWHFAQTDSSKLALTKALCVCKSYVDLCKTSVVVTKVPSHLGLRPSDLWPHLTSVLQIFLPIWDCALQTSGHILLLVLQVILPIWNGTLQTSDHILLSVLQVFLVLTHLE